MTRTTTAQLRQASKLADPCMAVMALEAIANDCIAGIETEIMNPKGGVEKIVRHEHATALKAIMSIQEIVQRYEEVTDESITVVLDFGEAKLHP